MQEIEKEFDTKDVILIFFFFQDEVFLISREMYYLASVSMVITIEDRLKKEILLSSKDNREKIEELSLGQLKTRLSHKLSSNSLNAIGKIQEYRNKLIHTNMSGFEKMNLIEYYDSDGKLIPIDNLHSGLEPILRHESSRINVIHNSKIPLEIMKLGLIVLRELQADWLIQVEPVFDKTLDDTLRRRQEFKAVKFYD
ncbi:MAG: hypothetical protein WC506_05660 [Candidatus Micrarchaeia archaeon]